MCNKMSDVRLSNASPTLERVDARQPDNAKPPVCRNLFGTPGHREEFQSFFRATMHEAEQAFEERWDFDPVTNTPRNPPRNFKWEETTSAPEYYSRPAHERQPSREDADLHGGNDPQDAEERNERRSDPRPARHGSRKRPARLSGGCSSECQSKRSHTDDDDDDEEQPDCPASQSVTCVELTPSKSDNGTLLH